MASQLLIALNCKKEVSETLFSNCLAIAIRAFQTGPSFFALSRYFTVLRYSLCRTCTA